MFAVTGGKGGCGKTTTAFAVARALARRGADPLVLDADVDMPDLHILADVPPEPNSADLAAGAHPECVSHRPPDSPGVSVVPAGNGEQTSDALAAAADWHGPVLVDCPAGAGADATIPLRHASASVLVTTDTPQSLADAAKTATLAERVGAPVRATLVRGPDAESVRPPGDCERVVRTDTNRVEDVLRDPEFRVVANQLSDLILKAARECQSGRI